MRRRSSVYDLEIFRRTATWAEEIVYKDMDYRDYAGAPAEIGERLATLDIFLRYLLPDGPSKTLLKLWRQYLIQKKKAYFAGVTANQITMLAFLKGGKIPQIDAIINPESSTG